MSGLTFNEYPIDARELAVRLAAKFGEIPQNAGYNTYTLDARDLLAKIADEKSLKCYPCLAEKSSEYLWDVCWWNEEDDDRRMLMAVESEWQHSIAAVKYDFEKLLVAKAPLKLLITDSWGWPDKFKGPLDTLLRKYAHHIEGERYVWLDLEGKPAVGPAQLKVHEWTAKDSGFNRDAAFEFVFTQPLQRESAAGA